MSSTTPHVPIHLIWATRHRTPWLDSSWRPRLYRYMSGLCRNIGVGLYIAGGIEDHVHLLIELPPTVTIADAMRDIKANSSRFIHETWPDRADLRVATAYSAFAVSRSGRDEVYRYIENQVQHHATPHR